MANFEAIQNEQTFRKYGDATTEEIIISYPADIKLSGSIDGHASVFDSFTGFFRFLGPDGSILVNESVTGSNRVFLPQAKTNTRSIRKELPNLPPGVYTVQIGGTNQYSGGSVTVSWVEKRPLPTTGSLLGGGDGDDGGGDAPSLVSWGPTIGGIRIPLLGIVAVVGLAAVGISLAARRR